MLQQRLVVVYNPRSSQAARVRAEVFPVARGLQGYMVGKYEVKPTSVEENARGLARILMDGDLVVAAGGDGTASITLNGVMLAGKKVTMGVLGYGNFNDMARTLGVKNLTQLVENYEAKKATGLWPLEVLVNGKHWRYAACYVTAGMFAESTRVFDEKDVRGDLQGKQGGLVYSIKTLAGWYFKNRRKKFISPGAYCKERIPEGTTDYLAVNGRSMARVMRGGGSYLQGSGFVSSVQRLGGLGRLTWFMLRSMVRKVPGNYASHDILKFDNPCEIELQAEGEYQRFERVREVEVRKAEYAVKCVCG